MERKIIAELLRGEKTQTQLNDAIGNRKTREMNNKLAELQALGKSRQRSIGGQRGPERKRYSGRWFAPSNELQILQIDADYHLRLPSYYGINLH